MTLRGIRYAAFIALAYLCYSICGCIIEIDGDETIDAKAAASRLRTAATTTVLRCHSDVSGPENDPVPGLAKALCISPHNPDLLLLESDVNRCSAIVLSLPCMSSAHLTGFFAVQLALACPIEVVTFVFNDRKQPFQGNIRHGTSFGGEGVTPFYFPCL